MFTPAVSIILPIYNGEKYLKECLDSIKSQTFEDFEVIAVLDGCTDRSEEILNLHKDERFTIIKKEHNEGVIAGLNDCIRLSKADIIIRMDSDDTIEAERVEKQLQFMEKNPDIALVGTWIDHIDETGKQVEKAYPFPATHEEIKASFRTHNSIGGATSCWRKEALTQVGGFHSDYLRCEDFALNMAFLAAGYRVANIQEVLYHYRMHPTQVTKVHKKMMYENTNRMYAHYGPLIWGKDAPDFQIGLSLPHRIVRKLKKLIKT